jgi:hypothetical protein
MKIKAKFGLGVADEWRAFSRSILTNVRAADKTERASNRASQYIEALSSIVTELMNGYVKEDGAKS